MIFRSQGRSNRVDVTPDAGAQTDAMSTPSSLQASTKCDFPVTGATTCVNVLDLITPMRYADAWVLQQRLHRERVAGLRPDILVMLEHQPVYTVGPRTTPSAWGNDPMASHLNGVEIQHVTRGGSITFHGPGQLVLYPIVRLTSHARGVRDYVARLEEAAIRLIKPAVGAGYGGKCDPFCTELCASHMSRKLGRPVKIVLSREEVFYAHRGRHPTRMWLKMGVKHDGSITAIDFKAWAEGGAYSSYGVVTSYYLGVFMTMPYRLENYRFESMRLYTKIGRAHV